MTGAALSCTVIVCSAVLRFPDSSLAVQVILVEPTMYGADIAAPSLRAPLTVTLTQLSRAPGALIATLALLRPGSLLTDMSAGDVIDGRSLSLTVTVRDALAV